MTDDENTTTSATTSIDPTSVLGSLKARRQQLIETATIDLPVPRWTDPEIIVRYKPVDHSLIRRVQAQVEKAPADKRAEVEVNANADVLIRGCVGVFARIDGSGQEYSLRPGDETGELTRFDPDLATNLGLEERATARAVARALYLFDGDLIAAAGALADFSGYRTAEADAQVAGE